MNDLRPVGTYAGVEMFVRGGSSYSCPDLKLHGCRDDLALRRGMRRELKKRGLPVPPIDSVVWAANPPRGSARGRVAVDVRGSVMPAWRWDVVESPGGKLVKRFKTDAALNAWLKRHDARGPNPLLAVAGNPGRKRNAAKLVLAGFVLRDSVTPGAWLARCEYVMGDSAIAQYVGHGWTVRAALADLRAKLPAGVRLGVVTTEKVNPPLHPLGGSRGYRSYESPASLLSPGPGAWQRIKHIGGMSPAQVRAASYRGDVSARTVARRQAARNRNPGGVRAEVAGLLDAQYEKWLQHVDSLCLSKVGCSVHDLEDAPLRDWFDSGRGPAAAAVAALKRSGLGRNPGGAASRGRVFGSQVEELKYRHVARGARVHTFAKRGTKLEALPDGSVRIFNPKSRLWEDRVGT